MYSIPSDIKMKILFISLKRYNRLKLQDIELFELTCTSEFQIILGTNGSGKSSIMHELNPLPANRKAYSKGGHKIIYIEHRNKIYRLSSDFTHGNDHTFEIADNTDPDYTKLDYENINTGRTLKVQKQLVKDHFKITQEVVDILVGKTKFVLLPPIKRKELIVSFSGGDLDYAIDLHRKLVKKLSESGTIVKHNQKRIADETTKLVSTEEYIELEKRCQEYTLELEKLYNTGVNKNNHNLTAITDSIKSKLMSLSEMLSRLQGHKVRRPPNSNHIKNVGDLQREITNNDLHIQDCDRRISNYYEESSNIKNAIDILAQSNVGDYHALIEVTEGLKATLELTKAQVNYNLYTENVYEAAASANYVYTVLNELFLDIEDNSDRKYTRTLRSQADELAVNLKADLHRLQETRRSISHKLEHIESMRPEECPKCNHTWHPGIDVGSIPNMKAQLRDIDIEVTRKMDALHTAEIYIAAHAHYSDRVRVLVDLINTQQVHEPFWIYLQSIDVYYLDPLKAIAVVEKWFTDVQLSVTCYDLTKQIKINEDAIEVAKRAEGNNQKFSGAMLGDIETKINEAIRQREMYMQRYKDYSAYASDITAFEDIHVNAQEVAKRISQGFILYIEQGATDLVNEEIAQYQQMLAISASSLNQAKTVQAVIHSLEESLAESNRLHKVRDMLATALDPKVGLIAQYIKVFIDQMVEQVNVIISQVWGYDMRILACGDATDKKDAGDLNYKFPVVVKDSISDSDDIYETSSAQRDMFSFAFAMIAYLYLELDGYPIFLDELAPTMDEVHRINITNYVKALVDNNRHSQMFMISHYVTGHGIFSNAETCILNDANIINKPLNYNDHVVMR